MNRGFTLIELMITIAIFATTLSGIFGIFIAGSRQQSIALESQQVLSQASFALEFMSRSLRMANKETGQGCLSQQGLNYELTGEGSGVRFINSLDNNDCQEFFLDQGQLKYLKSNQQLPLTSDKLEIESFKFSLSGASQQDAVQPRLTVFLSIGAKTKGVPTLKLQTTISQRKLDVSF